MMHNCIVLSDIKALIFFSHQPLFNLVVSLLNLLNSSEISKVIVETEIVTNVLNKTKDIVSETCSYLLQVLDNVNLMGWAGNYFFYSEPATKVKQPAL